MYVPLFLVNRGLVIELQKGLLWKKRNIDLRVNIISLIP